MSNASEGKRSFWAWVGCGCGIVAFLGILAVGVPVLLGMRAIKTMRDPEAVAEKARDLLALDSMPAGYRSDFALSVPFIGDVVALSNDRRRFLYFRGARLGDDPARLDSGEIDLRELLRSGNVRFSHRDPIGGGAFDIDTLRVNWMAVLGDAGIEGVQFGDDDEGSRRDRDPAQLSSVMLLRCPGDRVKRARIAIFSGELPNTAVEVEEVEYTGTVADPDEIHDFLAELDLCGEASG